MTRLAPSLATAALFLAACQSSPPPTTPAGGGATTAATSGAAPSGDPSAAPSPTTTSTAPGGGDGTGALAATSTATPVATSAPAYDLATCPVGAATGQACASCVRSSCASDVTALNGACPDFAACICTGGSMPTCAPKLAADGRCQQLGQSISACVEKSCKTSCIQQRPSDPGPPSTTPKPPN